LLLGGVFSGYFYGLDGLKNTALVYSFLYTGEHLSDFYFRKMNGNFYLYGFLGFGILYKLALWLNKHPDFIVALYNCSDMLNK